jgi:beta-glucosidase
MEYSAGENIMTDFTPRKGMTPDQIAQTVDAILIAATLDEKIGMMSGKGFFKLFKASGKRWGADPYPAGGGIARLGVPVLYFTDGPRGVARGQSTCFPCSMARGASFDPDLEQRIGGIIGIEARAQGCTLSGAVCFNLLRHPAWGRAQETYGEDPHLLGVMGAALATGIQTHNVIATIKHFALNSMENARFTIDVHIDDRALHEVYLPHFKHALEAGCATVMSAYNKMNGEYCGQHRHLLTDILRHEWGFDGFVHSDWVFGVRNVYGASAGLDIENPEPIVFGQKLADAVAAGQVEPQVVDTACRRILQVMYRFACAEDPLPAYSIEMVAQQSHIDVALEAAEKSAVLLSNNGVLPLQKAAIKKLAVLGRLAALENTGDNGSSRVQPKYIVTALQGLRQYLGAAIVLGGDESDLVAARSAALAADIAVVVVGYTAKEEGEYIPGDMNLGQDVPDGVADAAKDQLAPVTKLDIGGDRDSLDLPADQIKLIEAAHASGTPVIVVIVAGSAVMVEAWHDKASAILQTFYSGMEGGTALAKLLFGDVSPSGKLPFTVARNAQDYPFFDKAAASITYDLYHGYSLFERNGKTPRYAFGHGLSYASFAYRALKVRGSAEALEVSVSVKNTGMVPATEIAQVYIGFPESTVERQKKLLKAFRRVALAPGETKTIHCKVRKEDLRWRNGQHWVLEPGRYTVYAGGSSDDAVLISAVVDM